MRSSYIFVLGSVLLLAGCACLPKELPAIANGIGAGLLVVGAATYALLVGRAMVKGMVKDDVQRSLDRIEAKLDDAIPKQ